MQKWVNSPKILHRKSANLLKFNILDFDFLVDFQNGCYIRKLRTTVISSTHEMCLWFQCLSYLGKFKANFEVFDV